MIRQVTFGYILSPDELLFKRRLYFSTNLGLILSSRSVELRHGHVAYVGKDPLNMEQDEK